MRGVLQTSTISSTSTCEYREINNNNNNNNINDNEANVNDNNINESNTNAMVNSMVMVGLGGRAFGTRTDVEGDQAPVRW